MKRLYRSRRDRVILGVAGGLAEYFEVDPTLVRIVLVALGMGGFGVLLYIIAGIIVPENPYQNYAGQSGSYEQRPYDSRPGAPRPESDGAPAPSAPGSERSVEHAGMPTLDERPMEPPQVRDGAGARTFGFILVFLGIFFLAKRFFPFFDLGRLWPLVLILVGAYLVAGRRS